MNKDKKNIDLLVESKLKGFRESPPAYSWNRLEHDLDKQKTINRLSYFKWLAASILILFAFGTGYYYAKYRIQSLPKESKEVLIHEKIAGDQLTNMSGSTEPIEKITSKRQTHSSVQNKITPSESEAVKTPVVLDNAVIPVLPMKDPNNHLIAENNNQDIISDSILVNETISPFENSEENQLTESENVITFNKNENQKPIKSRSDELIPYQDTKSEIYGMETPERANARWIIGAQFAPVISYRDISLNYENQTGSSFKEEEATYNDTEEALMTFSGGVKIDYLFSKRWSVQSGCYYSKIGQVNNNALTFQQENDAYVLFAINTSTGSINIAFEKIPENIRKINPPKDTLEAIDLQNVKIIQNFDFLELPLMLRYKLIDHKFGINISGGISPAYLIENNIVLQVNSDKYDIGNSSNLTSVIFNSTVALGFDYKFSKNLSLSLEPNFKYSLNPINKDSNFDYHPYYFSLFTGINYKF